MLKHKSKLWKMNRRIDYWRMNCYEYFKKTTRQIRSDKVDKNRVSVICPKCDGFGWINEPYYDENHQMKIGPDCPVCKHFGYITINSFLFYETIEKRKNKGSAVTKETRARKKFVAQFNQ